MGLIQEAERILYEEAAKVADIAGMPRSAVGRGITSIIDGASLDILDGLGGSVADFLTGDGDDKKRKARQRARVTAGRFAEVLGKAIAAEINRLGLGPLFERISGAAKVARWSDTLPDISQLRGVPVGKGQQAAGVFMDAAAPAQSVSVPPTLYRSNAWAVMVQLWGGFSDVAGRFAAVMAALDAGGLPDPQAGERALKRAYATQWGELEAAGVRLGATRRQEAVIQPDNSWQETARRVPSWPAEGLPQGLSSINPKTGRRYIAGDGWFQMTQAQRTAWLARNGLPPEYAFADGEERYRARVGTKKKSGGAWAWALGLGGAALGGLAFMRRRKPRKRSR